MMGYIDMLLGCFIYFLQPEIQNNNSMESWTQIWKVNTQASFASLYPSRTLHWRSEREGKSRSQFGSPVEQSLVQSVSWQSHNQCTGKSTPAWPWSVPMLDLLGPAVGLWPFRTRLEQFPSRLKGPFKGGCSCYCDSLQLSVHTSAAGGVTKQDFW